MENNEIKVGMIVRYSARWCTEGERKYLHLVKENRLNPTTDKMTHWLIETINMENAVFNPTETVDDFMIEPTGLTIDDIINQQEGR